MPTSRANLPSLLSRDRRQMKKKKKGFLSNLKKGALHKMLGIKQGKKIPTSKTAIKSTDSALMRKRKQFAINARKWAKGKKKKK